MDLDYETAAACPQNPELWDMTVRALRYALEITIAWYNEQGDLTDTTVITAMGKPHIAWYDAYRVARSLARGRPVQVKEKRYQRTTNGIEVIA
jgi:hypothetical protein